MPPRASSQVSLSLSSCHSSLTRENAIQITHSDRNKINTVAKAVETVQKEIIIKIIKSNHDKLIALSKEESNLLSARDTSRTQMP